MNAKTIGSILLALLILPILACAGGDSTSGGSNGSGTTSRVGGDDEVLKLLPKETTRIQVAATDAITGGSVPESMTDLFEGTWKNYSLGGEDEIVTVDDVGKVVWAISPEGGIVMLGGSRIDFAAISQWLADEDTNIARTSYQGQEMWGNDSVAMVLLQSDGYLVFGDTDAVKELLKVKARGTGSLADDSENSLKKAYEDAASGWYVSASDDCDVISTELRSCEAYSITAGQGKEDYLVNITYRLTFRSEQRAESQALDIEDWIEDRNYEWDIEEVKADGVSVEAKMSGDEEDFSARWIGTDNIYTPPTLPTAVPEPESRNTNRSGTAPTATWSPSASATEAPAPTTAPTEAPFEEEALLKYEGICTSSIQSEGAIRSEWIENCFSYGSGLYYAYYYAFRINLPTTISIELTSDVYAQLLLLQGPVGAWDVLESYASGNSGAIEFITHLPAGEYIIEVASDYLVNYKLSTYLGDSPPSPTSAPRPTAAPAPTAAPEAPNQSATLKEYAAMSAGRPGAVYVGDLAQLAGPAPTTPDYDLADHAGMVPLDALERHQWVYESDYYKSLLDKAKLTNPTPLSYDGQGITIQLACINRALLPCILLEHYLASNLAARTNGKLTLEVTSFPELGVAGPDNLELIRNGTLSAVTIYSGHVAGDLPQIEVQNLWGIYSSREQEFEATQAIIKDMEELVLAETGGVIMNHNWHAGNDQFFFCRERVNTLDSFAGKKTRSHGAALSDWINGMGADALWVAFAEVYTALERGILDCGVAGANAAYSQRWYEVTSYIVGPLPSFSTSTNVINRDVWGSIPSDLQQIIIEEAAKSELEALRLAAVQNEIGLQRNIDAGLEFIEFPSEMNAHSFEVAINGVIPNWVDRVGGPDTPIVADTFNNKVGPIVGLRIQPNGQAVKTN